MSRAVSGATLVETVVALVVFYAGVLAVVGTVTLAARLMADADRQRRAVRGTRQTLDSLSFFGFTGGGQRSDASGRVEWTGAASGDLATVSVRFFSPDSTVGPDLAVTGVVRSGT